jgi:Na+/proline symporter
MLRWIWELVKIILTMLVGALLWNIFMYICRTYPMVFWSGISLYFVVCSIMSVKVYYSEKKYTQLTGKPSKTIDSKTGLTTEIQTDEFWKWFFKGEK